MSPVVQMSYPVLTLPFCFSSSSSPTQSTTFVTLHQSYIFICIGSKGLMLREEAGQIFKLIRLIHFQLRLLGVKQVEKDLKARVDG